MKTIFLIVYLWHEWGGGNASTGGPSLSITPMPSWSICDKAGRAAKEFADAQKAPTAGFLSAWVAHPASYRCVEIHE